MALGSPFHPECRPLLHPVHLGLSPGEKALIALMLLPELLLASSLGFWHEPPFSPQFVLSTSLASVPTSTTRM